MIKYLSKKKIILVNKKTCERHGGNFNPPANFLHEENLDYLIEAVKSEMFGQALYPTLSDKAGLYMYNIISNHIFSDGNKRAGLEAAILFLGMNGYRLKKSLKLTDIFNFTINVASGNCSLKDTQKWFEDNVVNEYLN